MTESLSLVRLIVEGVALNRVVANHSFRRAPPVDSLVCTGRFPSVQIVCPSVALKSTVTKLPTASVPLTTVLTVRVMIHVVVVPLEPAHRSVICVEVNAITVPCSVLFPGSHSPREGFAPVGFVTSAQLTRSAAPTRMQI